MSHTHTASLFKHDADRDLSGNNAALLVPSGWISLEQLMTVKVETKELELYLAGGAVKYEKFAKRTNPIVWS